jgi:hypothetical protein
VIGVAVARRGFDPRKADQYDEIRLINRELARRGGPGGAYREPPDEID